MKYYLLNTPNSNHKLSFNQFAHRHNYKVTTISCIVISIITLLLLSSRLFINYSEFITHNEDYALLLVLTLVVSALYLALIFTVDRITNKKTKHLLKYFAGLTYPLLIIGFMMWASFIAQRNPANTMSMFLMGMFYVGCLWILSFREVLLISVLSLTGLGIGLIFFQADVEKLVLNYIVGGYILVVFYVVSRIIYSYHFNYFDQLKTIEAKNQEISKINKLQTEMLGIAVHDLRGPVNNIITLTELVKNYANTEGEREEYYEMILSACHESNHIIQDLITIAKEKNQNFDLEEVNINSFLEQLVVGWQHTLSENRTLTIHTPSKQLYAIIDVQKMQRVISNLINNAVKFTPEDGQISVILTEYDNRLRISVKDNGIGIPESSLPYLFDRFSKAGRPGLKGEKSHGLGLSICRQIIEQHNGAIGVDSTENVGTIFNIDLTITKTEIKPLIPEKAVKVSAEVQY